MKYAVRFMIVRLLVVSFSVFVARPAFASREVIIVPPSVEVSQATMNELYTMVDRGVSSKASDEEVTTIVWGIRRTYDHMSAEQQLELIDLLLLRTKFALNDAKEGPFMLYFIGGVTAAIMTGSAFFAFISPPKREGLKVALSLAAAGGVAWVTGLVKLSSIEDHAALLNRELGGLRLATLNKANAEAMK